ncbi:hypothetical protein C8R43DRAFT_1130540 [Mycena crocata]|nr:hypothetical protein C8R43DRAFT_1130540 [Mycena crocata]
MPATEKQTSNTSYFGTRGKLVLFFCLGLCLLGLCICVLMQRYRQQLQTEETPHSCIPAPTTPDKPVCHDVHLRRAEGVPTWDSIQPLAVQTPFFHRSQKDTSESSVNLWPTIKRDERPGIQPANLFSSSDAFLNAVPLLDDFQNLHTTVLVAMPVPPLNGPLRIVDNMALGVAYTVFPFTCS